MSIRGTSPNAPESRAINPDKPGEWLALGAIFVLAVVARVFRLGDSSFWLDETASWWFASRSLGEIWGQIPFYEPHPPLFYTLLWGWLRFFGQSESALRSLSVLASVATVPVIYGIGRLSLAGKDGKWMGLCAALLAAVYPVQVRYAQEARPYALLTLAVAVLLLGLQWIIANPEVLDRPLKTISSDSRTPARAVLVAVVLSCSAAFWLHNTAIVLVAPLLVAAAILVLAKIGLSWQLVRNLALVGAMILIIWLPNLQWLMSGLSSIQAGFWLQVPGFKDVAYALGGLLGSAEIASEVTSKVVLTLITLLLCLLGMIALWQRGSRATSLFLVGAMTIPWGISLLVSYLVTPIFMSRVLVWIEVPAFVLVAANLLWLRSPFLRASVAAIAASFLAFVVATGWGREVKEPWREVARLLLQEAGPQDLIILANANAQVPMMYYGVPGATSATVLVFPDAFPLPMGQTGYADGFFVRSVVDDAVLKRVREAAERTKRIWYVSRGRNIYDWEEKIPRALQEMRGSRTVRVVHGEAILLAEYGTGGADPARGEAGVSRNGRTAG